MDFRLLIEPSEHGYYFGTSPDMPELFVSGNSPEQVLITAKEVAKHIRNLKREVAASGGTLRYQDGVAIIDGAALRTPHP
jgi:hypothetical protein